MDFGKFPNYRSDLFKATDVNSFSSFRLAVLRLRIITWTAFVVLLFFREKCCMEITGHGSRPSSR